MPTSSMVCPVLVGRDDEMRTLREAIETGGLVLVGGEAGIGKSRLVRDFADWARARKHPVVWGRAESVSRAGPYSMILDLVEDASVLLHDAAGDARELASLLMKLTAGAEPPARQVSARIRGLLARAPGVVVALEDLHFADELSLAVVAHLARSAGDDRTLIVATLRPAGPGGPLSRLLDVVTRDRIATTIDLEPLGRADVASMVTAMWEAEPSDEDLAALEKLGEGVPFFVEELASARAAGQKDVPASIARAVDARLDRLDDEARAVVRAASLMSGALDPAVLALACDIPESRIPAHLITAVRAGLLTDDEGHLVFRHALVRGSIARPIVSVERREMHAKLARGIEVRYAADLAPHASALAEHWTEAGDGERAAGYWVQAGERALGAGALEEAVEAFKAAAASSSGAFKAKAGMGLAEVSMRMRDYAGARKAFLEIAEHAKTRGLADHAARALGRAAGAAFFEYDASGAQLFDDALSLVPASSSLAALLQVQKGYALIRFMADRDAAQPLLEGALTRARDQHLIDVEVRALHGLAWVAESDGDLEKASELCAYAYDLASGTEDHEEIAGLSTDRALFAAETGRAAYAFELVEESRQVFVSRLMASQSDHMNHLAAWLLWRRGIAAEAERRAALLETTRFAYMWGRVVRVWAAIERGEEDLAAAILRGWWDEIGDGPLRLRSMLDPANATTNESYAALAEIVFDAHSGSPIRDEGVASARAFFEGAPPSPDVQALVGRLYAMILVRRGENELAAGVLGRVDEFLETHAFPWHKAFVHETRGRIAAAKGDASSASHHYRNAVRSFEEAENVGDRARVLRSLALATTGDERAELLRAARALAAEAGASVEQNRIEADLRAAGVRPRAGRPKGSKRAPDELSSREQEVAVLVAAGATNADIAGRLFISERTVEDHIAKATKRLGLNGRAGLATWAAKRGRI
ncbi:MAG: AAA family ATPase [Actinomycetota bacterium]